MTLSYSVRLPQDYGPITEAYLRIISHDTDYPAYTISETFEIIPCMGSVRNNGSYNYHNNYDDSVDALFVELKGQRVQQWFTFKLEEAQAVQKKILQAWVDILTRELNRVDSILKEAK